MYFLMNSSHKYQQPAAIATSFLIKVSNQKEVIRRRSPPALTLVESVIALFVIIVSLITNDLIVPFCILLSASQLTGYGGTGS